MNEPPYTSYFQSVTPFQSYEPYDGAEHFQSVVPSRPSYPSNTNMNMYSFSLYPARSQPSGTINYSRLQVQTLRTLPYSQYSAIPSLALQNRNTKIHIELKNKSLSNFVKENQPPKSLSNFLKENQSPKLNLKKSREFIDCPICYIDTYGYKFISCKYHKFCKKCINGWSKNKDIVSCPICRRC